jgi:hypothetical protein
LPADSSAIGARVASSFGALGSSLYSPIRLNPLGQPRMMHNPFHHPLPSDSTATFSHSHYNPVLQGAAALAAGEHAPSSADQYTRPGPSLSPHMHAALPTSLGRAAIHAAQQSDALAQGGKQSAGTHLRTVAHLPPHVGKTPKRPSALPLAGKDTAQVRDQDRRREMHPAEAAGLQSQPSSGMGGTGCDLGASIESPVMISAADPLVSPSRFSHGFVGRSSQE